ncbi:hypothetical protein LSAT2_017936, partial [Lamellibrachia satsuma]
YLSYFIFQTKRANPRHLWPSAVFYSSELSHHVFIYPLSRPSRQTNGKRYWLK